MNRKLMRQISNEWRSNLWLALELAIVSVAIYYMTDTLVRGARVEALPNGYDTSDVYSLTVNSLPAHNDYYTYPTDSATRASEQINNFEALLKSIESRPGVECVTAGGNIQVFQYNYWGSVIHAKENRDSIVASGANVREGTPELAEVLRLKPLAGAESVDDLRKVLERGELIISRSVGRELTDGYADNPYVDGLPGARKLIGQEVMFHGRTRTVGAVIEDTRRGYMEVSYAGNIIDPIRRGSAEIPSNNQILVRVMPGRGADFERDFKENPKAYRAGQFYIPECVSMDANCKAMEREERIEQRNKIIVMVFLLVTIFLGLLGTFWFRTVSRKSEIAVRKSVGARASDIFRRLIAEGMLILTVATIPAVIIDYIIARSGEDDNWTYYGQIFYGGPWLHLAICAGITYLLMTLMTVAGIWLPARRAMKTDPATALRAE